MMHYRLTLNNDTVIFRHVANPKGLSPSELLADYLNEIEVKGIKVISFA